MPIFEAAAICMASRAMNALPRMSVDTTHAMCDALPVTSSTVAANLQMYEVRVRQTRKTQYTTTSTLYLHERSERKKE